MKIGVVGAGPAGLICAWQLAEAGHSVTILDQSKELGAQGSGVLIQPVGLAVLDYLGVRTQVEECGQRVKRIRGYAGFTKTRKVIDANYSLLNREFDYALGINRSELWKLLFDKVKASGVTVQHGVHVASLCYHSTSRVELIGDDQQGVGIFDLIIDASGANSKLREFSEGIGQQYLLDSGSLWASVKMIDETVFDPQEMLVFTGDKNQGLGLMPTGRIMAGGCKTFTLFLTIDCRKDLPWKTVSFIDWRNELIAKWPSLKNLLVQIQSPDQLYLARFKHHTMSKPYGDRIVYVGDAAHCSSPQLGQGINMSLIDALVLCQSLAHKDHVNDALKLYAKGRKNHVLAYQTLAKLLTPFYHSRDAVAIFVRDQYFYLVFKMNLFKRFTAAILSGNIFWPLKRVTAKIVSNPNHCCPKNRMHKKGL